MVNTPASESPDLYPSAFEYVKALAEMGNSGAQRELGHFYLGMYDSVTEDLVEAVKWYRKAAEQGDAHAQRHIGDCYSSGNGVVADYVEAVKWYRKAAEQNIDGAQFKLGECLFNGCGMPADKVEAAQWYRKASQLGYAIAEYKLALCYATGEGVRKSEYIAALLFQRAAYGGVTPALVYLAHYYLNGLAVPKDEVEGYAYCNLACSGEVGISQYESQREMRSLRDSLEEKLPYDARLKGQQRTKELAEELKVKMSSRQPSASGPRPEDYTYLSSKWHEAQRLKGDRVMPVPEAVTAIPAFTPPVPPVAPATATKPEAIGFFFCWAVSSVAIFAFLCAIGFLNSGAQGFAVFFGRGLILAPLGGLVVGGIWKMMSK